MNRDIEYKITPPEKNNRLNLQELWGYRNLFFMLAWRDVTVRYKQTVLGVIWVCFQPISLTLIFTFIFNRLIKIHSDAGVPYPLFILLGIIIWQYCSGIITNASTSLVKNENLIKKIYFPRVIIPAASALTGLVDMAVPLILYVVMMAHYGFKLSIAGVAALSVFIFFVMVYALGIGFFLAALNVKYRDVNHVVPFLIQIYMFATPVIYPMTMLKDHPVINFVMLYLNPMSGMIINARASILGAPQFEWGVFVFSSLMSTIIFISGLRYLLNSERGFADIV